MLLNLPPGTAIWLGIAILLGIFEIFTVGLLFVFFAFGALVAALVSIWSDSMLLEAVVFVVASLLLIVFARPLFRKAFKIGDQPQRPSNVDALIGMEVLVLEPVDRLQGRVKILNTGEVWSAYLEAETVGPTLEMNALGVIRKVDGAKLVIVPK
ncbi:MAG TPA: NfeD family protein [Oculatellaceae cyanobacterium]|jgi:membrane protein implicated in regulation of membrane protease activity